MASLATKGQTLVKGYSAYYNLDPHTKSKPKFVPATFHFFVFKEFLVLTVFISAVLEGAQPKFQLFMKYARVELAPPTPADIPQIRSGIQKLMTGFRTGRWKQVPVKEAWVNTLVTAEVCFWFFVGECIGKRRVVGYKV